MNADGDLNRGLCAAPQPGAEVLEPPGPASERERSFLMLAEQAQLGVCAVNLRAMRFASVNDPLSRLTGYSRDELMRMNPLDMLDQPGRMLLRERYRHWLDGEKDAENVDCRVLSRDGRERFAELSVAFGGDACGKPSEAYVIAHDITDRKRAESALRLRESKATALAEELERRNKLITDFFINISHEFKTPISILMLGIDLMDRKSMKLPDGLGIRRQIPAMRQNAYRLSRLVSNLLDITKLEAGFMEPSWEKREVIEWLSRLVKSTEIYAKQRGITLGFTSDAGEMTMLTDGFMLDRIMLNLLSNAYKHTLPGGRVDVACRVEPDRVRVSVRDTGEGIPAEKQSIIFDRFRQVNTSLTRMSDGCGIGLALTKSLVELLGGTLSFQSAVGEGSEFSFELPSLERESVAKMVDQGSMKLERRVQLELSDIVIGMD